MDNVLVYVTASNVKEGEFIARTLVEERLVACVNLRGSHRAFYWWDGAVQDEEEVSFIAKTKASLVQQLTERIKEIHSYSCPCVITLPIENGNPAFLKWIDEETTAPATREP